MPLLEWGTTIGDILNNLRGALDNLVWALTVAEYDPPAPLARLGKDERPWRTVALPVLREEKDWNGKLASHLWGVGPCARARLKQLQPFSSGADPERHWLWMLNELWNADKHRTVTVVRWLAGLQRIDIRSKPGQPILPDQFNRLFEAGSCFEREPGPFEHDTETVARFWVKPIALHYQMPTNLEVEMKVRQGFDIAFAQGPPGYGNSALQLLRDFLKQARQFITELS